MSDYSNWGDTHVESRCDPRTANEGWGETQTNEGWGALQADEIDAFNSWMDNNEQSWNETITQNSEIRERTELVATQSSQKSVERSFISNDQQRTKLQNNFRNQYKKPKSHDNYQNQEPYETETQETKPKVFNSNYEHPQIVTPETQVFDKRLSPSTLPPIVEEWEYSNTRWEDDVTSSFDDTVVKPITVQLSQAQISPQTSEPPKNDSQVNDISNVENVEKRKDVGKNLYTQCIDLVAKRIKALNKRLAKIEKSEEFLQEDPKNRSKLNNDQLQSIENKEQVIGAIKELEEIYKKIVNIEVEGKKNKKSKAD
ncbi:24947_t:CDS:2 [Dentiscutata erythropus]|uniref:24947_t:CDS:1 n=1 Tax=Dentiscutata erythropus TaxID=1348616 RepID=A0A9N8ZTZ2_9GLOM|nr:24947_t:CDS:2 [Dentiscutata erythropus]